MKSCDIVMRKSVPHRPLMYLCSLLYWMCVNVKGVPQEFEQQELGTDVKMQKRRSEILLSGPPDSMASSSKDVCLSVSGCLCAFLTCTVAVCSLTEASCTYCTWMSLACRGEPSTVVALPSADATAISWAPRST